MGVSKCPDCGRVKAQSFLDIVNGRCPKWYAERDARAEKDCKVFSIKVDGLIPGLDLLEAKLREGFELGLTITDDIRLWDRDGICYCSGKTLRELIVNLVMMEC